MYAKYLLKYQLQILAHNNYIFLHLQIYSMYPVAKRFIRQLFMYYHFSKIKFKLITKRGIKLIIIGFCQKQKTRAKIRSIENFSILCHIKQRNQIIIHLFYLEESFFTLLLISPYNQSYLQSSVTKKQCETL